MASPDPGNTVLAVSKPSSHPSKTKRPNYNIIHADPLPVTIYHPPPLIPHNPLSILHHIYLYFFPPIISHKDEYTGIFSPTTMSVEVHDPRAVLDLWQRGFWGKGSLSRSEPTWLHREMRRQGDTVVGETSEEITRRRRDQRKEMKKERARKEKEELQKVKEAEAKNAEKGSVSNGKPVIADSKLVVNLEEEINGLNEEEAKIPQNPQPVDGFGLPSPPLSAAEEVETENTKATVIAMMEDKKEVPSIPSTSSVDETGPLASVSVPKPEPIPQTVTGLVAEEMKVEKRVVIKNQEHLQLTFMEAFFLVYALGVLSVKTSSSSAPLSTSEVLQLFLRYSAFPPQPEDSISLEMLNPDNPFLINYAVYHHFRSLGWVVKNGVKFSVDYLLYKRGPVFSHAEFAILIMPSYSRWAGRSDPVKEWYWLHSITRVNSQVKKTVVLVYVDVPTPEEVRGWIEEDDGLKNLISRYTIREVALRRWIPGRNRD